MGPQCDISVTDSSQGVLYVLKWTASDLYGFGRSPLGNGGRGVAMSAQCRRMGAGTVGVEWGGNGWPVLKSSQQAEEEARAVVDESATQARNADEGSPLGEPDEGTEGESEA